MDKNYLLIGARIRFFRMQAGFSQEHLAELTGLSRNYIGNIERGEKQPSIKTIRKLADSLGTAPDELVGRTPASDVSEFTKELEHLLLNSSTEESEIILKFAKCISVILREYTISK